MLSELNLGEMLVAAAILDELKETAPFMRGETAGRMLARLKPEHQTRIGDFIADRITRG